MSNSSENGTFDLESILFEIDTPPDDPLPFDPYVFGRTDFDFMEACWSMEASYGIRITPNLVLSVSLDNKRVVGFYIHNVSQVMKDVK